MTMTATATSKGKLTLQQRAYLLGYRRAIARMRRELFEVRKGWEDEISDLKDTIDGIQRHYNNIKEVAKAMAEREPGVTLH